MAGFDRLGLKSQVLDQMASKADSGLMEKLKAKLAGVKPGQDIDPGDETGPTGPNPKALAGAKLGGAVDDMGGGGGPPTPAVPPGIGPVPELTAGAEEDPLADIDPALLEALLQELLKKKEQSAAPVPVSAPTPME